MPSTWSPAPHSADSLAALAARVRWLTAMCAFLTIGFAGLLAWQFFPRPSLYEANRFVLRDDRWRRRAELGFRSDGSPALRLYNVEGRTRVSLALPHDGSGSLRLSDLAGRDRARLGVDADGAPSLALVGKDDGASARIAIGAEGRAELALREGGMVVWRAP